jgi:hypothetical protein
MAPMAQSDLQPSNTEQALSLVRNGRSGGDTSEVGPPKPEPRLWESGESQAKVATPTSTASTLGGKRGNTTKSGHTSRRGFGRDERAEDEDPRVRNQKQECEGSLIRDCLVRTDTGL